MKLEELLENSNHILCEHDGIQIYVEQISESAIKVGLVATSGGMVKKSLQGFGKFAKKHPYITGALAGYAGDAIRKYKKNKRNTITFYTKDIQEKNMYKDMIAQLMKSGHYRKEKESFVDGGYLFVLKRLG